MIEINEQIEALLAGFCVDGEAIPVRFLHYEGHGDKYITWQQVDADALLYGDDLLRGLVLYYDFDVWAKGNYTGILSALRETLEGAGFRWQPTRSSGDLYEPDTGYYHKTMCFAYMKEETPWQESDYLSSATAN